ncbi:MAG: 2-C-methyl-D-erythritol 2,4-cyclodiphosphate synthase, partial [Victivallales bacterium]|nr:2-C-methyl-D-erythritol 2,4-cyclodiphosphate synthase [Victivallales bacterium]
MDLRIGQGYDIHRLAEGRELWLGGIRIASPVGLVGHSDADALLHAVIDAVLGALALGDIGGWFPDTDETWRGADSKMLLRRVLEDERVAPWRLVNLDCTI